MATPVSKSNNDSMYVSCFYDSVQYSYLSLHCVEVEHVGSFVGEEILICGGSFAIEGVPFRNPLLLKLTVLLLRQSPHPFKRSIRIPLTLLPLNLRCLVCT